MSERHEASAWRWVPKQTVKEFLEDQSPLYAAALAFFGIFAGVALVALVILGAHALWGGGEAARGQLFQMAATLLGEDRANAVQTLIANATPPGSGWIATTITVLVLAWSASRLFRYLEASLNRIWDMKAREGRSLWRSLRKRAVSFALVLGVWVLLIAALVAQSILSGFASAVEDVMPYDPVVMRLLRALVLVALFAALVTLLFKYLPDARIRWADAAVGGAATAVLLTLGVFLIGSFIGQSRLVQTYGALSSVALALLWFYYTALIFLFGAEFTQVYARARGHPLEPEAELAERRGAKGQSRRARGA